MNNAEKISGRLNISKGLPSPPQVLLKLLDACNTNNVSPKKLADIVFKDPSISSKVLQLINSTFIGLREKVNDLEKAIVYLGVDAIKNVAISASVVQVFGRAKSSERFNLHHFWWHSVMCGTIAKRITKKTGEAAEDEAFLSGMLHDIGKLILLVNFKGKYTTAIEEAEGDTALLRLKEKEIGAGHHELGAWLVRQWRLSSLMADAVLYHHESMERIIDALPLVKIVYLANILSSEGAENDNRGAAAAKTLFKLDTGQVEDILAGAREEVADVARSLGLPANPPVSTKAGGLGPQSVEIHEEYGSPDKKLTATVKHLSLMYGTLQNLLKARSKKEILKTATQGFQILFGIQQLFFFLYDPEENSLKSYSSSGIFGKGTEENLILSCSGSQNLPARCFAEGTQLDSFQQTGEQPLSIADEQILRLLGTEAMHCLPMNADDESVGVIVVGATADRSRYMFEQQELLDLFARQTGTCLYIHGIKQTQAGLIQTERLEASATMARKVVHEVNNPLGIIKNYLKILGLKLPEKHPAQSELSVISEEIDRVGQIVRSLKNYASPTVSNLASVDINQLLKDILVIAENSILKPAMIRLDFIPDPAVPNIHTEQNSLKQIIINLVKNAAEAMPNGGNIHVSTMFHTPSNQMLNTGKNPPGSVELLIKDDGPGIPEEIKQHLFEPFHSSKKEGHSGLGLSIVRNIVKQLNGTITCESSSQTGTAFRIILPAVSEEFIKNRGE